MPALSSAGCVGDHIACGIAGISVRKISPQLESRRIKAFAQRQGVIFMADCLGGLKFLGITVREQTYDQIDLWDGAIIEIYKGKHSVDEHVD